MVRRMEATTCPGKTPIHWQSEEEARTSAMGPGKKSKTRTERKVVDEYGMGQCGKSKDGSKNGGRIVRRRFDIGLVRRTAKTSPEKCVWIGGLKKREERKDANLNKALQTWINKLCGESGCKFVDIGPKGSGGAVFGSEQEASAAMAKLKGKIFQGCKLQSDVYVRGWTDDLYNHS